MTQVAEGIDGLRLQSDDLAQKLDPQRRPAGPGGNHAVEVKGGHIPRFASQDPMAPLLRLAQPARLIVLERQVQKLVDVVFYDCSPAFAADTSTESSGAKWRSYLRHRPTERS